jgi:hypothetical protein
VVCDQEIPAGEGVSRAANGNLHCALHLRQLDLFEVLGKNSPFRELTPTASELRRATESSQFLELDPRHFGVSRSVKIRSVIMSICAGLRACHTAS